MKPSRISVLIIGTLPPPIGGAGVSLQQLLDALVRRDDVQFVHVNTGGIRGRPISAPFRFVAVAWRILSNARRADVVSLQTVPTGLPFLGPFAWAASRLWGKPFMIRMFGGQDCFEMGGVRGAVNRWFIRRCDLYLAETKAATEAARRAGVARADWYATGRPMPALPPEEAGRKRACRRFVFLSQVKLSKGIGTLVEAAEKIEADVHIDVFGPFFEGLDEDFFKDRRHIRYCGVVSPDRVLEVLASYDAVVLPTHWPGEGYPGIIMEAYAAGLPVITTNWLAIPEIVDESCGILVEPKNPGALAEAMTRLNQDSEWYARIRAGSRAKRDLFDASRWVNCFVEHCRQLSKKL